MERPYVYYYNTTCDQHNLEKEVLNGFRGMESMMTEQRSMAETAESSHLFVLVSSCFV